MTVIATDGNAIEPIAVQRIVLMHGERFDFVLNATNDRNLSKLENLLTNTFIFVMIGLKFCFR